MPWNDGKYAKRINRLLFYYLLNTPNRLANCVFITLLIQILNDMISIIDAINIGTPVNVATAPFIPVGSPAGTAPGTHITEDFNKFATLNLFHTYCTDIITIKQLFLNYRFAADTLYTNKLFPLINMIYCICNLYKLYYATPANPVNRISCFNITNYIRSVHNLYPYLNQYEQEYINKIRTFFVDVRQSCQTNINLITSIMVALP